ncbi:MAG: hypothetical protein IGS48_14630 [Oscillatoriales cyanobacterium C42_A2020_001]|nr:hypothetical protein [Leptolyngbyaceae cyanobacterium C42_A2020_001]
MRGHKERSVETLRESEHPEYLRGYRDGVRDRRSTVRPASGDGILGALLAIALIVGIGYSGYNYATTGRFLPLGIDINRPLPSSETSQP